MLVRELNTSWHSSRISNILFSPNLMMLEILEGEIYKSFGAYILVVPIVEPVRILIFRNASLKLAMTGSFA